MRCVVKLLLCNGGVCAVRVRTSNIVLYIHIRIRIQMTIMCSMYITYILDADRIAVELSAFRRIFNLVCCFIEINALSGKFIVKRE